MGHYYSEMGYEDKDAAEKETRKKCLENATKLIESEINNRGIASVLADILEDPMSAKMKYYWRASC